MSARFAESTKSRIGFQMLHFESYAETVEQLFPDRFTLQNKIAMFAARSQRTQDPVTINQNLCLLEAGYRWKGNEFPIAPDLKRSLGRMRHHPVRANSMRQEGFFQLINSPRLNIFERMYLALIWYSGQRPFNILQLSLEDFVLRTVSMAEQLQHKVFCPFQLVVTFHTGKNFSNEELAVGRIRSDIPSNDVNRLPVLAIDPLAARRTSPSRPCLGDQNRQSSQSDASSFATSIPSAGVHSVFTPSRCSSALGRLGSSTRVDSGVGAAQAPGRFGGLHRRFSLPRRGRKRQADVDTVSPGDCATGVPCGRKSTSVSDESPTVSCSAAGVPPPVHTHISGTSRIGIRNSVAVNVRQGARETKTPSEFLQPDLAGQSCTHSSDNFKNLRNPFVIIRSLADSSSPFPCFNILRPLNFKEMGLSRREQAQWPIDTMPQALNLSKIRDEAPDIADLIDIVMDPHKFEAHFVIQNSSGFFGNSRIERFINQLLQSGVIRPISRRKARHIMPIFQDRNSPRKSCAWCRMRFHKTRFFDVPPHLHLPNMADIENFVNAWKIAWECDGKSWFNQIPIASSIHHHFAFRCGGKTYAWTRFGDGMVLGAHHRTHGDASNCKTAH